MPEAHRPFRLRTAFPHLLLTLVLLAAAQLPAPAAAQLSDAPRLSRQQTLLIRVGKWDPVEEAYVGWDSLGGDFKIGPDGDVHLPMAGTVEAAGRTPDELAEAISRRLQERTGVRGEIQATVEVAAFQPVYVLGGVRSPGAYPYTPGLMVLQALGLAGGVTPAETAFLRNERSALSSMGSYRVMQLDLLRRLATIARLRAEMEETDIEVPPEIERAPMGEELIRREREIKEARDAGLASSLSQIDELEALLEERIARLTEQIGLRDRQLSLIQNELENASQLVERGLSTASRKSSLERQVADQQVRRLELETAKLNAEQRLNEARRDRADLINNRRRELVEALRSERGQVEELRVRMETEAALYAEAIRSGEGFVRLEGLGAPVLEVTRRSDRETRTFQADRTDELQGGDVLEVLIPELGEPAEVPAGRLGPLEGAEQLIPGPPARSVDIETPAALLR